MARRKHGSEAVFSRLGHFRLGHEGADAGDRRVVHQQRRVALSLDHIGRAVPVAPGHFDESLRREEIGIAAADGEQRHVRQRLEKSPAVRRRFVEPQGFERLHQFGVEGRAERPARLLERRAGISLDLGFAQRGENARSSSCGRSPSRRPANSARRITQILADAGEALQFDYRADIVEHHAAHQRRPGCREQHRMQAAARGADEDCLVNFDRRELRLNVGILEGEIVMAPVGIVVGFAAATISTAMTRRFCPAAPAASASASGPKSAPLRARPGRQTTGRPVSSGLP